MIGEDGTLLGVVSRLSFCVCLFCICIMSERHTSGQRAGIGGQMNGPDTRAAAVLEIRRMRQLIPGSMGFG